MAADDQQTRMLLRAILETAPAVIFAKDLQGRMLIANEAATNLIGKPWADVAGLTDREFLADVVQGDAIMTNDRRILESGIAEVVEEEITTPGMPPSIWLSTKSPMRDAEGRVVGLIGVSIDITAKKRVEQELKDLNETLEQRVAERTRERDRAWKLSQDILLVADTDSRILAVSPAWESSLGWPQEALIGMSFLDLVHPDDREATQREAGRLSEGLPTDRFINRYRHRDGSYRWISWAAVPEDGRFYATGRDITGERRREEALADAENNLRQAQRMDAIGQLTGGIAHDFNNMLQGIGGSLELMQRRLARGRTEDAARFVQEAQKAVSRAASLTNRLLAFARRQALAPRPVEPDKLLDGVAELLRRTVGPHIAVVLHKHDGVWLIHCDPNELETALLNAAINARDAMPDGGRLTIRTNDTELTPGDLAGHGDVAPGRYVQIVISDTGTGMEPQVLARAFEPFYTTKPLGHGAGLGLSQLHGFVRQSGGFARLESTPGEGTTIRLYFPRYAGVAARDDARSIPRDEKPSAVGDATVLLVEDEPAVRAMVVDRLSELGCQILEAADGPAGLRIVESDVPLALLLTDVGLPGLNGRQLADAARQKRPDIPVVLLTGYVGAALDDWSLPPGIEVVRKPFKLDDLAERVARILAGRPGSAKTES
jgi:PAS domain S-box-containing protein